MASLNDLMTKFAHATNTSTPAGTSPARQPAATSGDHTKLASGGEPMSNSLADIYMRIAEQDHNHEKRAAAYAPAVEQELDDVDFAAMAEKIAEAEAEEQVGDGDDGGGEIIKIAAEYDAAGRLMARGFVSEFYKLAEGLTTASDNQNADSESAAKTPALGERGLPTLATNYAGSPNNDVSLVTAGQAGKANYADTLAPTKTISAGQGTGTDPEQAAISLGGGSPLGFATVRDLQA